MSNPQLQQSGTWASQTKQTVRVRDEGFTILSEGLRPIVEYVLNFLNPQTRSTARYGRFENRRSPCPSDVRSTVPYSRRTSPANVRLSM